MNKTFPATIEKLYDMLEYIGLYADSIGFSEEIVKKIELALEEALVNVITHGYKTREGNITISLKTTEPLGIAITLIDEGIPFNPDATTLSSPGEEKTVGGWGLFLIFKMMDKMEYQRVDGKNVLKLEKYLNP